MQIENRAARGAAWGTAFGLCLGMTFLGLWWFGRDSAARGLDGLGDVIEAAFYLGLPLSFALIPLTWVSASMDGVGNVIVALLFVLIAFAPNCLVAGLVIGALLGLPRPREAPTLRGTI